MHGLCAAKSLPPPRRLCFCWTLFVCLSVGLCVSKITQKVMDVRNIRIKNYQNLVIGFQVTVENVGDVSLRHSVHVLFLCPVSASSLTTTKNTKTKIDENVF